MVVSFTINGTRRTIDAPPLTRLIDILRDHLRLTGTKEGCGEGECGSCTVLLDGEPVNACLIPIGQCEGCELITAEGIVAAGKSASLTEAFVEHGAVQCGICTPGMVVSAYALLRRLPEPDDHQIRCALAGNICRCTGYGGIVEAVKHAAAALKAEGAR